MQLIAVITDDVAAKKILACLGLPIRAPPRGRPFSRQQPLMADHDRPFVDTSDLPAYDS
jgi:hypothetical protein